MNPTKSESVLCPRNIRRRVWCIHYGECLDKALSESWEGWTCSECQDFERVVFLDVGAIVEEALKCGNLLCAVAHVLESPRVSTKRLQAMLNEMDW